MVSRLVKKSNSTIRLSTWVPSCSTKSPVKPVTVAGDGTTTATVLARAIYEEGLRSISMGANPTVVRRGIEKAVEAALASVQKLARPVESKEQVAQVGAISANNDRTIGDLIADAMEQVGRDGVITVEEGKANETTLEFAEGMQFDKGYISPYFVTEAEGMKAVLGGLPDPVVRKENFKPAGLGASS